MERSASPIPRACQSEALLACSMFPELDEAAEEHHAVLNLGRRLFSDRRDDARFYPHELEVARDDCRTSYPAFPDDPDDPGHILIDLEKTITGCRWLCRNHSASSETRHVFAEPTLRHIVFRRNRKNLCACEKRVDGGTLLWKQEEN